MWAGLVKTTSGRYIRHTHFSAQELRLKIKKKNLLILFGWQTFTTDSFTLPPADRHDYTYRNKTEFYLCLFSWPCPVMHFNLKARTVLSLWCQLLEWSFSTAWWMPDPIWYFEGVNCADLPFSEHESFEFTTVSWRHKCLVNLVRHTRTCPSNGKLSLHTV